MKFIENCKNYKYANIILALVFAFTLFLQCCFFHWQAFHSIVISSLWKDPLYFIKFYGTKISISVFIASFVLLFKRKSWIIYFSTIISIWSIAELVYFRSNRIFFDAFSFTMIGNMDGFWDSVLIYIYASDLIIFLYTLILIVAYLVLKNKNKNVFNGILGIILSISLNIISCIGLVEWKINNIVSVNPLNKETISGKTGLEPNKEKYIRSFSTIHAFLYDFKEFILIPFGNDRYIMSNNELEKTNEFINDTTIKETNSQSKLIIILVESFETWSLSNDITPNLCKFISKNNILYAIKVKTQTKGGNSADGQMIVNTGLLPIFKGAVCYKYPFNTFPSLAKIYNKSAAIIPGNLGIWNQKFMSDSYGIIDNYETPSTDRDIFLKLDSIYDKYNYIITLTISSHSPFNSCLNQDVKTTPNMPELMRNYLKCINYMDENLAGFLHKIETDSTLKNSTIVITGDHVVFPNEIRNDFSNFCKTNKTSYNVNNIYTPLIIYSPNIKKKYIIEHEALQMDVYTTILDVIDCKDYYWKGFGVSLLDSTNLTNRPISEEDAFILSDKLIRANYFKEVEDNLNVYK